MNKSRNDYERTMCLCLVRIVIYHPCRLRTMLYMIYHPTNNSSSQNTGSSTPYAHGFDTYMTPDPSQLIQDVQWVYEYENPEFYNMLLQNDKQLSHGRNKRGKSIRPSY
jgi:hypothetical protein